MENILTATLSGLTADDADTAEFNRVQPFYVCIPSTYDSTSAVLDGATVSVKIQTGPSEYTVMQDTGGNVATISSLDECLSVSSYGNNDFVCRVNGATANTVIPAILISGK